MPPMRPVLNMKAIIITNDIHIEALALITDKPTSLVHLQSMLDENGAMQFLENVANSGDFLFSEELNPRWKIACKFLQHRTG